MKKNKTLSFSTLLITISLMILIANPVRAQDLDNFNPPENKADNMSATIYDLTRTENVIDFAQSHDLYYENGRVRVVVEAETGWTGGPEVTIEVKEGGMFQVMVPVDDITALSKDSEVSYIREPQSAHPLEPGSDGDGGDFPFLAIISALLISSAIIAIVVLWGSEHL